MKKKSVGLWLVVIILLASMPIFAQESYYIQVGAFSTYANAEKQTVLLSNLNLESTIIKINGLHKVFAGPFDSETKARQAQDTIETEGLSSFLVLKSRMYDAPPVVVPIKPVEANLEPLGPETEQESQIEEVPVEEAPVEEVPVEEAPVEEAPGQDDNVSESEGDMPSTGDQGETEGAREPVEVQDTTEEEEKDFDDYKMFTVVFILALWLIFILLVMAFRLNQNKKKI